MRRVVLVGSVFICTACNPGPPPPVNTGDFLPDAELAGYEPDAVTTPPPSEGQNFFPYGLTYAASIQTISLGLPFPGESGLTDYAWETLSWSTVFDTLCGTGVLLASDPKMVVGGQYLESQSAYPAYAVLNSVGGGLFLYHTGFQGDLLEGAQCVRIPGSSIPDSLLDQPRVAWLPPVGGQESPQLAIVWIGGEFWPDADHTLATLTLNSLSGDVEPESITFETLPDPVTPAANTDFGDCSVPIGGRSERGRGSVVASASGELFHAYTNYFDDTQPAADPPVPRRIYVEKLSAPRWSICLDDFGADGVVTSENYFDLGDPDLAFDEATGSLLTAYPSRTSIDGYRDITLAAANLNFATDPAGWQKFVVNDQDDIQGDRGHPNLAVNTLDPLERLASGAVYLSWYEPAQDASVPWPFSALVTRQARGYRFTGGTLTPRSASFTVSEPFAPNVTDEPIVTTNDPRGVHEYQTMTFIPGTADWVGIWGQPNNPADFFNPDSFEIDLHFATWD